jgi:hypothetical protein
MNTYVDELKKESFLNVRSYGSGLQVESSYNHNDFDFYDLFICDDYFEIDDILDELEQKFDLEDSFKDMIEKTSKLEIATNKKAQKTAKTILEYINKDKE